MISAEEFMSQLDGIDIKIKNKEFEITKWRNIALGQKSPTIDERVQSSPDLHKMEKAVVKYTLLEDEMNEQMAVLIDRKREIIHAIEKLPLEYYDILHKLYVQKMSLTKTARKIGISKTTAYERRDVALLELQKILNLPNEKTTENRSEL